MRINLPVALRIMILNVLKLRRGAKRLDIPIQLAQPFVQVRKAAADVGDVALEVLHVDGVEADDGGVEAHICFGDLLSKVIRLRMLRQVLLRARQRLEKRVHGGLVGVLGGGETGLVDAVVDVVVGPFVRRVDLLLQRLGVQIHVLVFLGQEAIEFGIEHADDLTGLVADDFALLDVVEGRDGEAAFVFGVDLEINVV